MRLCKDCRRCAPHPLFEEEGLSFRHAKCIRRHEIDYVSGGEIDTGDYCSAERSGGWFDSLILGSCGKRGRYFEPKD